MCQDPAEVVSEVVMKGGEFGRKRLIKGVGKGHKARDCPGHVPEAVPSRMKTV